MEALRKVSGPKAEASRTAANVVFARRDKRHARAGGSPLAELFIFSLTHCACAHYPVCPDLLDLTSGQKK